MGYLLSRCILQNQHNLHGEIFNQGRFSGEVWGSWQPSLINKCCLECLLASLIHLLFLLTLGLTKNRRKIQIQPVTGSVLDCSEDGIFKREILYKAPLASCITLCLSHFVVVVWGLTFRWKNKWYQVMCVELAGAVQVMAWFTMTFAMKNIIKERRGRFPGLLRTWWIFSCFSSSFTFYSHTLKLRKNLKLRVDAWMDILSFPICIFLCIVAIYGKTRITKSFPEHIQEPLLHSSPKRVTAREQVTHYASAGLLSLASFSWIDKFLSLGYKKPIELDDIPQLAKEDCVEAAYTSLRENWDAVKADHSLDTPLLLKSIILSFWKGVAVNACFGALYTCSSYVGPYLIDDFVEFLGGKQRISNKGYVLAGILIGSKVVESLAQRHWSFGIQQWALRLRAALTALIYRKGLCLSYQSRQKHTSGEIINYMTVDVQRIGDFAFYLHDFWLLPVQISFCLLILYRNLGLASLVALAGTIIMMLANLPLSRIQEKLQGRMMDMKDKRMRTTSEVLRNMKELKLQAWELRYLEKLKGLRKFEYMWLCKFLYTQSAVVSLFWGAPILVAVITFGMCMFIGKPLTAGRVLSALTIFRILQDSLYNFPDFVAVIAQTKVSLDRIEKFLKEQELQPDAIERYPTSMGDNAVEIKEASFSWNSSADDATLVGLSLQIRKGMRVAVCGMVGSGKSSFLSCILGEIPKLSGTVKTIGSRAYVAQSAWIQSGKVEENILFGKSMNRAKYQDVLQMCALERDLELFSHGDQTQIGERGINLSGGQKQRIQMARAIYQDADMYLLDDPLSAVDAHTGTQLFKECLLGALATKTLVYVTHQVEFMQAADLIVVMRDGKIAQVGNYGELLEAGTDFSALVEAHSRALEFIDTVGNSRLPDVEYLSRMEANMEMKQEGSKVPLNKQDCKRLKRENSRVEESAEQTLTQISPEEERETGKVSFQVYWSYLTAAYNGALIPVILLAQTLFQLLQIVSNYWMAWAAPKTFNENPDVTRTHLMLVYVSLALGSVLCISTRAVLITVVSLQTAQKFFMSMLRCIFCAPMSFFDATPTGRILNRSSMDQSALDLEIPEKLANLLLSISQLLGIIVVMSQVAWEVLGLFIIVFTLCIWLQRYYIASARELTRLVGIGKSPIIHHFGESISGATTIRGFDQEARFVEKNLQLIDCYSQPLFYSFAAMEWLCFRMDMLANFIFGCTLVLMVSLRAGTIDPSIGGLAMTYGLNLNILQAMVIWNICNVENKIVSLERIQQYTCIPSEAPYVIETSRPLANWPNKGTIHIKNLQVRYGAHMPLVLHNITCTIFGGKKVGVVGRTGSGKSTLIQALFRIVEPIGGNILIDGLDIFSMGLHDLRSRLSIISQDPIMFQGTVRENLDPLKEHTDAEVWEALEKSQLGAMMQAKDQNLDTLVMENGENWSVGQRQLFCLGRALLKGRKILVLDEATASVDTSTDRVVQRLIRSEFADCTVITIAHRIPTVIDSDWVLVLSDGKLAEYNDPRKLLEDKSSLFASLVSEYLTRSSAVSHLKDMAGSEPSGFLDIHEIT